MQFQMKKIKREKKRVDKEKKQNDKALKQQAKLQKRAEKEKKKTEKLETKKLKAEARAKAKQDKEALKKRKKRDTPSQDEEIEENGQPKLDVEIPKKVKRTKRSKLNMLKRMSKKTKGACKESPENASKQEATGGSSPAAEVKKAPTGVKNGKGKNSKAKVAARDAKGSKKSRGGSKAEPAKDIVDLVKATICECKKTDCIHPNWQPLDANQKDFQLSVYWSRMAVGVKISQGCLKPAKGQRAKSTSKWSQVAYFCCPTTCIYSNMILAREFVTWLN